jgi:hypothetical protein
VFVVDPIIKIVISPILKLSTIIKIFVEWADHILWMPGTDYQTHAPRHTRPGRKETPKGGTALGCQRGAMAQLPASRPNSMHSFSSHISHLASVWQRFQPRCQVLMLPASLPRRPSQINIVPLFLSNMDNFDTETLIIEIRSRPSPRD